MNLVMTLVNNTALLMGLLACIGLILQKQTPKDVIAGTVKTVIGFMMITVGSNAISSQVSAFSTLFTAGFGVEGVTTEVGIAASLALGQYGTQIGLIMIIGFIVGLVLAKLTRLKSIFLNGSHYMLFSCVLALVLIAIGLPMTAVVIVGGVVLGACGAFLPMICQKYTKEITGSDDIAIGHFNCIGYAFCGWLGSLIGGKKEEGENASDIKLPDWLNVFHDFVFSVALFMVLLFYIVVIACKVNGQTEVLSSTLGTTVWYLYPVITGLQFACGLSVMFAGVNQFLTEITKAFVAIQSKYLPNAKLAVDCPALFPYAPNAVLIGFVSALLGGLFGTFLMSAFHSSIIMIPSTTICFFTGGTCGVYGNCRGGIKGAVLGAFIVGIVLCVFPVVLYPAFVELGIAGASFPNVDYNVVGSIIYYIGKLFH